MKFEVIIGRGGKSSKVGFKIIQLIYVNPPYIQYVCRMSGPPVFWAFLRFFLFPLLQTWLPSTQQTKTFASNFILDRNDFFSLPDILKLLSKRRKPITSWVLRGLCYTAATALIVECLRPVWVARQWAVDSAHLKLRLSAHKHLNNIKKDKSGNKTKSAILRNPWKYILLPKNCSKAQKNGFS